MVSNVLLRAERDSINARIGVFTTRIATIIKKETELGNDRLNTNLVNLLLVDPAIRCVELIDSAGRVLADAPDKVGCQKLDDKKTLLVPFDDKTNTNVARAI